MTTNAAVADALRWKKLPVLDDGFVCLVDVMGDDQAIVQAARVARSRERDECREKLNRLGLLRPAENHEEPR